MNSEKDALEQFEQSTTPRPATPPPATPTACNSTACGPDLTGPGGNPHPPVGGGAVRQQTWPEPTVPVSAQFRPGAYPAGEIQKYRPTAEKTADSAATRVALARARLLADQRGAAALAELRHAAEVHRQVRAWARAWMAPGGAAGRHRRPHRGEGGAADRQRRPQGGPGVPHGLLPQQRGRALHPQHRGQHSAAIRRCHEN